MIAPSNTVEKRPTEGELTEPQARSAFASSMGASIDGFPPASPATYVLYRQMRANETIAMARIAAFAPIKASEWSVELVDASDTGEDTDDPRVKLVHDSLLWMRSHILHHLRFAPDYGFQSFEKVWEARSIDGAMRWTYRKLKPLLPERTTIQIDKDTGSFAGLKQKDIVIPPEKSFVFTYDIEGDDMYGRSRFENIRTNSWRGYVDTCSKLGKLITKIASIIFMVEYPEGKARDASGTRIDTYDIAQAVIREVAKGNSIATPNTLARHARELIEHGVDVSKLKAWQFSFLEAASGHLAELLAVLQHQERLLIRGMLLPERSVIEASLSGSRADSETAGDLALMLAEDLQADLMQAINWHLVDPLLRYNFGEEAVGSVVITAKPINAEERNVLRGLITAFLSNPNNADIAMRLLDIDSGMDSLRIPRRTTIDDAANIAPETPEERARVADMAARLRDTLKENDEPEDATESPAAA